VNERIHLQAVSDSALAVVDERLVSNVGAVVFSDFIAVIDAGKSLSAALLLRETLEQTYHRPVRYVCVTHYHADHTTGLSAFKDVALVGPALVAAKLKDLPDWSRAEMAQAGESEVPALSLLFEDRVLITGDKSLEFQCCGGHTDCSAYGYLVEEKVLFSGDLVVAAEFPFAGDISVNPEVWMSTLRSWQGMEVECVVPGHGPASGPDEIGKQLEFLETLRDNTLAAINAGKAHTEVVVPDTVPVAPGHGWFVDRSLERWHAYYSGR
jgi:glyoxylase-like metal-dependent hydrolase (beta-lactamase superfamily II)